MTSADLAQGLRAQARAHGWQACREVCADLRAPVDCQRWRDARYRTLSYFLARYLAEREPHERCPA